MKETRTEEKTPSALKRRLRLALRIGAGLFAVVLLLFLAIAGWFFYWFLGSDLPIIVSKETTHLTSPLRENGLPDFEKALLHQLRENSTAKSNGAADFWMAMWSDEIGSPEDQQNFAEELGIAIPSTSDRLRWLSDEGLLQQMIEEMPSVRDEEEARKAIELASQQPWNRETMPALTTWVKSNQIALERIVTASRKDVFVSPLPGLLNDRYDPFLSLILPGPSALKEAALALSVRAMFLLNDGRPDEAWRDLRAAYVLARRMASGPFSVYVAHAGASANDVVTAIHSLVQSENIPAAVRLQILSDLSELSPLSDIRRALKLERWMYLDNIFYASEGIGEIGFAMRWVQIDWNTALRRGNEMYDTLEDIAGADWDKRKILFDEMAQDLEVMTKFVENVHKKDAFYDLELRSEVIASIFPPLLCPALDFLLAKHATIENNGALLRISVALSLFHSEQGAYPESLDELVPGFLRKPPVDLFASSPESVGKIGFR